MLRKNVIINDEKVREWKDLERTARCTMATFVSRQTGEIAVKRLALIFLFPISRVQTVVCKTAVMS
jgi:hypothetical protein